MLTLLIRYLSTNEFGGLENRQNKLKWWENYEFKSIANIIY